eukprot:CAMPEP_0206142148 /NCGR_PEP_ID=MMETSP1473-20131121/15796_1 /ASSEMBLY_ACC=CAM_ASM_001109 /TAXON_ID=1461547 /ORGANISM="Stichococcus sp, Strain RCC1054" /LENGTH=92 /DNA_ID=CAMNT_0053537033 /DNA_START=190 /DNA_END=468 /DNA_ORIENTATION=+
MLCRTASCVQPQKCARIQHRQLIKSGTLGEFAKRSWTDEHAKYVMQPGTIVNAAGQRDSLMGVTGPQGCRRMVCEPKELAAAETAVLLVKGD